jgi:hypothetical protein
MRPTPWGAYRLGHLDQHVIITCPLAQAATRLAAFFRSHASSDADADADVVRLALHVKADIPLVRSIEFERPVIATIVAHRISGDMEPRFRIDWAPQQPGPFPVFSGELVVEGTEDYDAFTLRLIGDYTPPLGAIGQGFDATVGHHIAQATGRDLLGQIRSAIEHDFVTAEADKQRANGGR